MSFVLLSGRTSLALFLDSSIKHDLYCSATSLAAVALALSSIIRQRTIPEVIIRPRNLSLPITRHFFASCDRFIAHFHTRSTPLIVSSNVKIVKCSQLPLFTSVDRPESICVFSVDLLAVVSSDLKNRCYCCLILALNCNLCFLGGPLSLLALVGNVGCHLSRLLRNSRPNWCFSIFCCRLDRYVNFLP